MLTKKEKMLKKYVLLSLLIVMGCERENVTGGVFTGIPVTEDSSTSSQDTLTDGIESDGTDPIIPDGAGICAGQCDEGWQSEYDCSCSEFCVLNDNCCEGFCEDCAEVEFCTTFPPDHGENDAKVISDNLPETLECGEVFKAEVVVRNTGTSTWTAVKKLRLGNQASTHVFGDFVRIEIPEDVSVEPDEEITFAFDLTAPPQEYMEHAFNVSFPTQWGMVHENIGWFGNKVIQDIAITCDAISSDPENESLSNPRRGLTDRKEEKLPSMALLFAEQPISTVMTCGQTATISMRVLNMGESTWTHDEQFGFGAWGNVSFLRKGVRVYVPEGEEIAPGESWNFQFDIVAPPASFVQNIHNPDLYGFQLEWSMIRENTEWFGKRLSRSIVINCPELVE